MGRVGVTARDVSSAAEALRKRGDPVTARTVREEMGTGSYSTIGELLDVWIRENPEPTSSAPVAQTLLPVHLADQLQRAAVAVWETMRETAERQMQAEREQYRQHVAELEARCADAVAAATDVTVNNDALQLELVEIKEREAAARAELNLEQTALQQERAARQEVTARANVQERHNGDLKAQLDRLHGLLESEGQRHAHDLDAAQVGHAAALEQARQDAERRLSELRDEMKRQVNVAEDRAAALESQLQTTRTAGETTVAEVRQQLEQTIRERAEAHGALEALREQLARQTPVPRSAKTAQVDKPVRRAPPRRT